MIRTKRAYEPVEDGDGRRFLVDHYWPRGIKKENLKMEAWMKQISPSAELCRWFDHTETRWPEFQKRYRAELESNMDSLHPLLDAAQGGDITLVYSARDEARNNAIVLKSFLEDILSAKA